MKILIACEFSGIVRDAFIAAGHDAMSCDLLPTEQPGPHYQGDCFDLDWSQYDMAIAHPPCTAICVSGNRYYSQTQSRNDGAEFVWKIWEQPVRKLCIENPVGVINSMIPDMPKPQYIQPWEHGHGETKKTGLWLRDLPPLMATSIVQGRENRIWKMSPSADRSKQRSLTYPGIAAAMAQQWGTPSRALTL